MLIKQETQGQPWVTDVLSEIRESNPPHRLGKPVHYRCANLAKENTNSFHKKEPRAGLELRDPRITNALLYQLSHHGFCPKADAKVMNIFEIRNYCLNFSCG